MPEKENTFIENSASNLSLTTYFSKLNFLHPQINTGYHFKSHIRRPKEKKPKYRNTAEVDPDQKGDMLNP